jgi:hypothetical protein
MFEDEDENEDETQADFSNMLFASAELWLKQMSKLPRRGRCLAYGDTLLHSETTRQVQPERCGGDRKK